MATEKINAVLMLEILGKPAEHVKESLKKIVDSIGNQKDVKIISRKIAEPRQLEENGKKQDVFTSFAEIEIETSLQQLMMIIFSATPSHIDIVLPEELKISNSSLNILFNELIRKIHQYDEIARTLMIERGIIAQQIKEGKLKVQIIKPDSKSGKSGEKKAKNIKRKAKKS